jgi:lipopolysaccharide/colanic/teichoic acid biosynthesis glycosyltransferase
MIVSRYEQQLVWDAILAEYRNLGKMYKSLFKRMIDLLIGSRTIALFLFLLVTIGLYFATNGKPFFFSTVQVKR